MFWWSKAFLHPAFIICFYVFNPTGLNPPANLYYPSILIPIRLHFVTTAVEMTNISNLIGFIHPRCCRIGPSIWTSCGVSARRSSWSGTIMRNSCCLNPYSQLGLTSRKGEAPLNKTWDISYCIYSTWWFQPV